MRRRDIVAALGALVLTRQGAVRAQGLAPRLIGFLSTATPDSDAPLLAAFRDGLNKSGKTEGRDFVMDYRWAEGRYDRLPALAAELLARNVVILAAVGGPAAKAAAQATHTVPVAFVSGGTPVEDGLVASLSRPGGNVTGVSWLNALLTPKRLEILRELVPQAKGIGYLSDPRALTAASQLAEVRAAAQAADFNLYVQEASSANEIERAFIEFARLHTPALLVGAAPFFSSQRHQITTIANRYRIPAIYPFDEFAIAGGLLSYGADLKNAYRMLGAYVGKMLAGARPGDLPVLQPTNFELVINLKTAKALGLTIPPSILARADEVIE